MKSVAQLKKERFQCFQVITMKDPTGFQYLTVEPCITNIFLDHKTYPNELFPAILQAIEQYGIEYYRECLRDDPTWGKKFYQLEVKYQQCYNEIYQNYLILLQQQQQQHQYQQQQYQQQQYQQQQQQQQYPNYNHQQGYQHSQGQQGFNNPQQQGGYNPKFNRNNQNQNGQQGQNQGQNQNYQQNNPNYQNQNNYPNRSNYQPGQRNPKYNQGNQYNPQGGQYQGQRTHQPGSNQNIEGQQGYSQNYQPHYNNQQNHNNQQSYYNNGSHGYQGNRQRNYNSNQQGYYPQQTQQDYTQPKYQEKVQEPVVVPEPPQPQPQPQPKHEPKPMKFSLKQIRQFINTFEFDCKQNVGEQLIKTVNEVQSWRKGQQSFEQKQDRPQQNNRLNRSKPSETKDSNAQKSFNTGKNYKPNAPTDLPKKPQRLQIALGANETLETRMIKNQIKEKAGKDFATMMEKENLTLDEIQKAEKEIKYNLNLLAPENIKEIQKDLSQYLFEDKEICEVLIKQIIEKAWTQPKYASTYAKLCSEFSKHPNASFKFEIKKEKKDNPFKVSLISTVQHSFDKKVQQLPEFTNDEEKDNWLKQNKKKILGNVKFIAELIRSKILRKKIMKICISQLIFTFLAKYYNYRKEQKFIDSYYDYYFQAIIQFIENVGEFYEKMDQNKKQQQGAISAYQPAEKKIIGLIEMTQVPPEQQIEEIMNLRADDYFELFDIIDNRVLRKHNNRLSALLLNLTERRTKKWQKHHAQSDGPKKLKDIKEDIAREQEQMSKIKNQKKASIEHLHDLVKAMFKDWESDSKNEKTHLKNILKEYTDIELYVGFLKQIADEKKQVIRKRIELFNVLLENFNGKNFKEAWFTSIKEMAFDSGDYPFIGSALALVLKKVLEKEGKGKIKDYFTKYEDEDEHGFMEEVYGRLYHYTQFEEVKELTTPNKKYGNMFEN